MIKSEIRNQNSTTFGGCNHDSTAFQWKELPFGTILHSWANWVMLKLQKPDQTRFQKQLPRNSPKLTSLFASIFPRKKKRKTLIEDTWANKKKNNLSIKPIFLDKDYSRSTFPLQKSRKIRLTTLNPVLDSTKTHPFSHHNLKNQK